MPVVGGFGRLWIAGMVGSSVRWCFCQVCVPGVDIGLDCDYLVTV